MNEMRRLINLVENVRPLAPVANKDRYEVRHTGTETTEGNPEEYEQDVNVFEYEILLDGEVVGEMTTDDGFGYMSGKLHDKDLPELSRYAGYDYTKPTEALRKFLSTKTGAKWAANIEKYRGAKFSNDYRFK